MENNFETGVRKKLNELHISPSKEIWEQIESRLGKKKKQRKVFWWLFLPLSLGLIFGTYHFFNSGLTEETERISLIENTTPKLNKSENRPFARQKSTGSLILEGNNEKTTDNTGDETGKKVISSKNIDEPTMKIIPDEEPVRSQVVTSISFTPIPHLAPEPLKPLYHHRMLILPENLRAFSSEDFIQKEKNRKNQVWKIGLSVTTGFSVFINTPRNRAFSRNQSGFSGSPVTNSSNPDITSGFFQSALASVPSYRNGFAFAAGINVTRDLNTHAAFNIGLEYVNFNIPQTADVISFSGQSSVRQYFNNTFHFMELPATVSLRTNVGKVRAKWDVGGNLSYLISANAKQYDGVQFYKDNSIFSPLQAGLNTGIAIGVLDRKGFKLNAGPYYQYHLNNLGREGTFGNHHLNYAGIKTEIIFRRKR